MLETLVPGARAVVIGANGGLGAAFVRALAADPRIGRVDALSRRPVAASAKLWPLPIDVLDETSIAAAAEALAGEPLDLVIVASGILHDGASLRPEKTWRQLDAQALARVYALNAIGPALVAKHLLPRLRRDHKAVFAALSARVGSIEDNRIGGWHAYRASKAALNQLLRTLAIELQRRHPLALCIGLHPGTVATPLSEPFQSGVPDGKLFDADYSAAQLLGVIDRLGPTDTGCLFAWNGERLPF